MNFKKIINLVAFILIFIGGIFIGYRETSNNAYIQNDESPMGVSIMLDYGDGSLNVYNAEKLPDNSSVFDLLKEFSNSKNIDLDYEDYGGEMGVFIKSINGVSNNMETGKFWQYWVNNEYAKVGPGLYLLKSGDVVEWKFIKGQF